MLRAGVSFPVLMKLLGHTDTGMTMRYVDVALTDLQRLPERAAEGVASGTVQENQTTSACRVPYTQKQQ